MFHQGLHVERHFSTSRSLSGLSHNLLSPPDTPKASYFEESALPSASEDSSTDSSNLCPLFRLSLEIRILIYEQLLNALSTELIVKDAGSVALRWIKTIHTGPDSEQDSLAILRTNKRISNEVVDVLYRRPLAININVTHCAHDIIPVVWNSSAILPKISRLLYIVDLNEIALSKSDPFKWILPTQNTQPKRIDVVIIPLREPRTIAETGNTIQGVKGMPKELEEIFTLFMNMLFREPSTSYTVDVGDSQELKEIVFDTLEHRCRIESLNVGNLCYNRSSLSQWQFP